VRDVVLKLTYESARGASVVEFLTAEKAVARIKRLRRPAVLERDGKIVGGIEETDGAQDDRRVRWNWWYERDEVR